MSQALFDAKKAWIQDEENAHSIMEILDFLKHPLIEEEISVNLLLVRKPDGRAHLYMHPLPDVPVCKDGWCGSALTLTPEFVKTFVDAQE